MNSRNYKRAKTFIFLTIGIFAAVAACLVPLTVNYFSTGSDVTAVALIFAGSMGLIFTTVPCLAMAVLGTVFAAKAKNEGIAKAKKFFVIGIVEIAVYGVSLPGMVLAVLSLFLRGGTLI